MIKTTYTNPLSIREMEKAIKLIKDNFEQKLSISLNLQRVSAPLFVSRESGLNDNLSGVERPVSFDILNIAGTTCEIVQSLAKWKRLALHRYSFNVGEGLYTDMNAIRRDDSVDNIHSIYVDQWDWEVIINKELRNETTLENTVVKIVNAIVDTFEIVQAEFATNNVTLTREVKFITTEELEILYPNLDAKGREYEITRKYGTVFIKHIGDKLPLSGVRHDGRAPDYDDWSLNGDLFFYHSVLDIALELSSMGIRVDSETMKSQLAKANALNRLNYSFHQMVVDNILPLTMGGGIGQSRLCMLMLGCFHIGEVQASIWSNEVIELCKNNNCNLL